MKIQMVYEMIAHHYMKIIRINATDYDSNHSWTYWLYKNNFAQSAVHNVAQLGIYYGITFGYKELGLERV